MWTARCWCCTIFFVTFTFYNNQAICITYLNTEFSSVRSVVSDSLRPHELQHARPPCPSPTPTVHPTSCPSSQWCHPATSSCVVPFSSCPQSLPASESYPMSQHFAWGGQSNGVSALASFLPKKHNRILLSYKKEHIWVRSNEEDETRAYYTKWNKSERERQLSYIKEYTWNLYSF